MPEKIYEIFLTGDFERDFKKLEKQEQERVNKVIRQLKTQPFTGKPLGFEFFREKKIGGKRLYFLIYEDFVVVFVIAFGGKKTQQGTIDRIKLQLSHYREEVKKAIEKNIKQIF